MSRVAESQNPINTVANAQLFYLVMAFLALLIVGIISPPFVMLRHVKLLRGDLENYKHTIVSTGLRWINGIFIVLMLAFLIACMIIITRFRNLVSSVEDFTCTDSLT